MQSDLHQFFPIQAPFYRWRNRGLVKLSNLPTVTNERWGQDSNPGHLTTVSSSLTLLCLNKVSQESIARAKACVWSPATSLYSLEQRPHEGAWGFRKIPKQEFGARSQAAALLSEQGITLASGVEAERAWFEMGCKHSGDASWAWSLNPGLAKVAPCTLSWGGNTLSSHFFFSAGIVWLT